MPYTKNDDCKHSESKYRERANPSKLWSLIERCVPFKCFYDVVAQNPLIRRGLDVWQAPPHQGYRRKAVLVSGMILRRARLLSKPVRGTVTNADAGLTNYKQAKV